MLNKIKQILIDNKNVDGYIISENITESNELFFIRKNVDMDRAKSVHYFKIIVYKDIEENGSKYRGSASTKIHPTMSDKEVNRTINDVLFAAQFVKNPCYPLVQPITDYKTMEASNFSKESMPYWMNEITKAVYKNDVYEKGGINSCEVFLNKVYSHIVNSEGIDVDSVSYNCMIEFITTWKESGEEVELYRCLNFSELDSESIADEVKTMINMCKEKAIAKATPVLEKSSVLLTGDAVKEFLSFYYTKSSANVVYNQGSTWKLGDKIQGQEVKGDLITMSIDPFMKNSTFSGAFDEDGLPLMAVTILEKGILKRYVANTRYAHYLKVAPTGFINNIIVQGGSKTVKELKAEVYLEIAAFSDFTVDKQTGDFCGEIRLALYFDGHKISAVTGGSISGNINELQKELFLSKELQKDNNFQGPKVIKLLNVTVTGVE